MKVANSCQQAAPSFQMNIQCSKRTQKMLKHELKCFYDDCVPQAKARFFENGTFDFEKIFESFKTQFRARTKGVGGKVIIGVNRKHNGGSISFNTAYKQNGQKIQSEGMLSEFHILPDKKIDCKYPFNIAISRILAGISDAIAKTGKGYGEENKVSKLFHEVLDKVNYQ